MSDNTPLFGTITEIAAALRRKDISSVELTQAYLDRLARLGPSLNALAHLTGKQALAQAGEADKLIRQELRGGRQRSLLLGIPYGAKDLLATLGAPTEWGSPAHIGQSFDYDATVIRNLRDAGAILVAKLSMIELAGAGGYRYATASINGACRNPWDTDHWSGGSSSGPGAATAASLAGFTIGSETWGSIICPSAFCGVTGLRPTYGRVSRWGAMPFSWTMDKIGPMARSAEDCGYILEAMAGSDSRDATTGDHSDFKYPFKRGKNRDIKGMKLGVIRPDYGSGPNSQPETGQVFDAALSVLEGQGVTLVDTITPKIPTDPAASSIVSIEGSAAFEELIRDKTRLAQLVDDEQQGGLLAGLVLPGVDYVRAQRLRTLAQRACVDIFQKYDALVAPGYAEVAPPITVSLDDYFVGSDKGLSGFGNLVGLPALCVPMGYGRGKLPLGMQFVGAAFDEATLLALGIAYQRQTQWHVKRPPAPFGI